MSWKNHNKQFSMHFWIYHKSLKSQRRGGTCMSTCFHVGCTDCTCHWSRGWLSHYSCQNATFCSFEDCGIKSGERKIWRWTLSEHRSSVSLREEPQWDGKTKSEQGKGPEFEPTRLSQDLQNGPNYCKMSGPPLAVSRNKCLSSLDETIFSLAPRNFTVEIL